MLLLWAITFVMFFAVGIMSIQQVILFSCWRESETDLCDKLRLIMAGETTVEAHDNEWYAKVAKSVNREFRNPYNLGRRRNLALFFNVGQDG